MAKNIPALEPLLKLFDDLVAMLPKTKQQNALNLIDEFKRLHPQPEPKVDGRSTAWDDQRRAEVSARWHQRRSDEVFYLYKYDPRRKEVIETVVKGVEECCDKLRIREAYLRSRLSSGRGQCTFGTGPNKMTISKTRFSSDPEERFCQEFMIRHNRMPAHHEYPSPGVY